MYDFYHIYVWITGYISKNISIFAVLNNYAKQWIKHKITMKYEH